VQECEADGCREIKDDRDKSPNAEMYESCVGWRQTGGCSPEGDREPTSDLDCDHTVAAGASGYCECSTDHKVGFTCTHEPLKCHDVCQKSGKQECEADDQEKKKSGSQAIAAKVVFDPSCIGWRQTGGCSAGGDREPKGDKACDNYIDDGSSGFCKCGGGRTAARSDCDHSRISCAEECAKETYTCVAWRQTGECRFDGPLEPRLDRSCEEQEPEGSVSGYCECGQGRRTRLRGCDDGLVAEESMTCALWCAQEWSLDFYQHLELPRSASAQEVKRAFRKLSLKYHPDRQKTTTALENAKVQKRFDNIRTAYETLSDEELRVVYDSGGHAALKEVIDAGGKKKDIAKVQAKNAEVSVTLESIYTGSSMTIAFGRKVICMGCKADNNRGKCAACGKCRDQTKIQLVQMGPFKMQQKVQVPSPLKCKNANVELDLLVERGVAGGTKVTFKSKGEQVPGMLPGDLIVKIKQAKHDTFKRRGNDLYTTVHISLKEALLGFVHTLVHLDGHEVILRSKDGEIIIPRQEIIVKDEGMPHHNNPSEHGDLYVKYRIDMPTSLTVDTQEWLAKHFPE